MEYSHASGTVEISVPARTSSLARVRRLLRAFLAEHEVPEYQRHGVVLVAHELAANAIVHGSARRDDVVTITIELEPQSVLIRVIDSAHSDATPASHEPTDWRESGRGMLMVGQLATWSEDLVNGQREVTATVPLGP
jgi:anti-sigma regulatory factor (Ser/Thr protein kinase)